MVPQKAAALSTENHFRATLLAYAHIAAYHSHMLVRFIAHAGISIEEDGYSILIDPWFLDSTPEYPVIESIGGGFKTIDFQIPKATEQIERYAPDAILVSHFHPHHSPIRDIGVLSQNSLSQGKEIRLYHPKANAETEQNLARNMIKGVKREGLEPNDKRKIGPFTIEAKRHTVPFHTAWLVTSTTGSVLHIADARLNRDEKIRVPDEAWEELRGLAPSVLFLSTGGHSLQRTGKDGTRTILEGGIFSPVEAAQVTKIISPRSVAGIGFYNHSIWKNRVEYILPAGLTEEQFRWAISWLAPEIRNVRLTPGFSFGIGEPMLAHACSLYLDS